jgi:hypothetical protein
MSIYTARNLFSHEAICHFGISVRATADVMTYGASKSDTRVGHFDDRLDGKYAKAGVSNRAICGVFGISLSLSHPLYSLLHFPPHHQRASKPPWICSSIHYYTCTRYPLLCYVDIWNVTRRHLFIHSLKVKQYYVCLELPCGIMATVCWTY